MRTMLSVAALAAALVVPSSATAPAETPAPSKSTWPSSANAKPKATCLASQSDFRSYARAVYRRDTIRKRALRKLDTMRSCASSRKAAKNMLRYQRRQGVLRARRLDPWGYLQDQIPAWGKAMLARLRGCETRGIPFPKNYRWDGHHKGAYQYTISTWARAGGSGNPAYASPAEQDVRTFRFYPSHRGEWACRA